MTPSPWDRGRPTILRRIGRPLLLALSALILGVDALLIQLPSFDRLDLRLHRWYLRLIDPTARHDLGYMTLNGFGHHTNLLVAIALGGGMMVMLGILLMRGRGWSACVLAVAVAGVLGLELLLKELIPRPGPVIDNGNIGLRTFPSGHTAVGVTLVLVACWIFSRPLRPQVRSLLLYAGAGISFLIVLSALTFHFPSEVVAGLALSCGWLAALSRGAARLVPRDAPVRPVGYVRIPTIPHPALELPTLRLNPVSDRAVQQRLDGWARRKAT